MNLRPLTRSLLIWGSGFGCLLIFAFFLSALTNLTGPVYWRAILAGSLAAAVALVAMEIIFRLTFKPTGSSTRLLNRITAGDLAFKAADIQRKTTSADMANAIRALVVNLERTIRRFSQLASDVSAISEQISTRSRALGRSAGQQLVSTETTSSSVAQIDQSINSVQRSMEDLSANAEETSTSILEMSASIEEVSRIADTLSEFVEQTGAAIEEMIASINEVATNTESFSSFAIETASSMVQMNATTEEIQKSAKRSSELARYVTDAANEGREAVSGTVSGMRNIQQAVEEAKLALGQLGERSMEIGEIVRVIDEIAGQTNLLALNAAIIAAQAGERGKGFAVVADEIRDLSERTSVSTEEIRTLIQNVQRGVERAAEQMTISADRVHDGVGLTARAEQVLDKILELTDRSTSSISEIARATEEQARGSQAATEAIEEVTKMVQQTATATQQQSQTSRKIGEQASLVRDYTKHLKRAMSEQETGSRAISRAMQNIMGSVSNVLESTSVLASESSAIVKAMSVIQKETRESNFSVSDLNQMANTLRHESTLLSQELGRFRLPDPHKGGSIVTSTVLPHKLTLDPVYCQFMALGFINKAVHGTLVSFGEGAELVADLAERWEVLDQGLRYRFHLRANVRFHNGRLLKAEDVRDTFLRLMSPEVDSSGKWIMRKVVGAEDVISGRSNSAAGLVVIDPQTIDFVLSEPLAFFLSLLSMPEAAIVPVEETSDPRRFALESPGAGPFRVEEAVEGKHVRLRRHREYYHPDRPNIDEVTFRLDLTSARDVAAAFMRGELDIAHGIPLQVVNEIRDNPAYAPYLLNTVQLHTSYLGYDSSRPPFNKVEVRQALNYAIDRKRINNQVFSGLGVQAKSLLPPGVLGYEPGLRGYEHDPERARTLLRSAGYASGFSVDYWTWDTDEFKNSGQVKLIVEDLAAVGIQVNVQNHTAVDARNHLKSPGHNSLFIGNWYADFPDSDNFFFIFFHSQSTAIPGLNYRNGSLDAAIDEARRTTDLERRTEIYRGLNEMVVQEAPMACLFHERFFVLFKPEVRGLRTSLVPPPVRYHEIWKE
jgi:methyl-accepting chemotaxis protein/ABC-type oligopeptide transport system substrate-binding subunit